MPFGPKRGLRVPEHRRTKTDAYFLLSPLLPANLGFNIVKFLDKSSRTCSPNISMDVLVRRDQHSILDTYKRRDLVMAQTQRVEVRTLTGHDPNRVHIGASNLFVLFKFVSLLSR